jgi:predicted dienelactone hydrolase
VFGHRRENVYKTEELASHGFIVVGLDHRDTFASVFPDGTVVRMPTFENTMAVYLAGIKERATDEQFVMDELSRMNSGDAMFAGRLDLERMGAFGWSFGGAAAAEVCRTDPRCKAGINMDGGFFVSNLVQTALSTPFMMLRADTPDSAMDDGRPDDRKSVIQKMTHDGYFVRTSGTEHYSYSDMPLVADKSSFQSIFGSPIHPLIPGVRINQIASAYVVSFFRKYLKGEDDHLLDGPPAEFPEVIEFFKQ